jgi:O-antigen ligase
MYCLGYHITSSITQIKGYFYVLVILGVITAAYGIHQSPEEINARMRKDAAFAERYKGIYYATSGGKLELRRFSTFVSSGAFGGVMAFVSAFAIVLFSDPRENKTERVLLMLALAPMSWAIVLTGARSALIMLAAGFGTIAWYRRKFQTFVLIPALLLFAVNYGMKQTEGHAGERFETLLDKETVMMRMLIPTMLGWEAIKDNPIGYGLGKSGYSVPFFLVGRTGYEDWRRADGDLGAMMIELGLVGLIVFGRVLWAAAKTVYDILIQLRGTPVSTIALACAACIVVTIIVFPIGSPFLSIPTGALTWFFLGTLQKLADGAVAGASTIPIAPAPAKPTKRFLYYRPKPAA